MFHRSFAAFLVNALFVCVFIYIYIFSFICSVRFLNFIFISIFYCYFSIVKSVVCVCVCSSNLILDFGRVLSHIVGDFLRYWLLVIEIDGETFYQVHNGCWPITQWDGWMCVYFIVCDFFFLPKNGHPTN